MTQAAANWCVYLLECTDGTYYCGTTNNLRKRMNDHCMGRGAKYTRGRGPFKLLGQSAPMTHGESLSLEYKVKKQPKHKKLATILFTWQSHPDG